MSFTWVWAFCEIAIDSMAQLFNFANVEIEPQAIAAGERLFEILWVDQEFFGNVSCRVGRLRSARCQLSSSAG